ncbi:Hypothetical protein GbCGDNIH7_8376 [Granulibacter bethesdensis]|nr:Hypothetical protein GbCGDNIH7_8376 [Granulibacter bethesdensis]
MAHYRLCSRRWPMLRRHRLILMRSCPQPFRLFCPPERIPHPCFRLRDRGSHWPGMMRSALPTRICWPGGAGRGLRSFVSHRWPISLLLRIVMRSGCPAATRSCTPHGLPLPPVSGPECSGRRSRVRCMASVAAIWCSGPVWKMRRASSIPCSPCYPMSPVSGSGGSILDTGRPFWKLVPCLGRRERYCGGMNSIMRG